MEQQYNKSYYEDMLLQMLEPLKEHFSKGKSRLELGSFAAGYGEKIAGMEGFSRILWGLVPYWAGGGKDLSLLPVMREGLCNGTNPASEEYWGDLGNKDQRMVEMAAISNGLLLIPELLWEPLTEQQKNYIAAWLYQINLYSLAENNWQFFNVMTNLALKKLGRKYSAERMQEAIDKYESFYLGNGWYSDGKRPQKDYYSSFAIQYYCLLYAYYQKDEDPERYTVYRERAAAFAKSFMYWFDDEGKALPFGRSLTYRFAQVAFFSVYAMTEVCKEKDSLSVGIIKGLIGRHLRYWMKQPVFDNGGVLTVGYHYPNLTMSEGYNSPGSPYWALKAFAFLALPGEHSFWRTEEAVLPEREPVKLLPEAQMLMADYSGEIIAYTAGQYSALPYTHDAEKYEKFSYSSTFGFSVPRSYCNLNDCAPDSMLAFEVQGFIYVRRRCEEYQLSESKVWAKWSPYPGINVETTIVPKGRGHIRKHRIESDIECICYDCGYAYPYHPEATKSAVTVAPAREQENASVHTVTARVEDKLGYSYVSSNVAGKDAGDCEGKGLIINASPNTNLMNPLTQIPALTIQIKKGVTEIETYVEACKYV